MRKIQFLDVIVNFYIFRLHVKIAGTSLENVTLEQYHKHPSGLLSRSITYGAYNPTQESISDLKNSSSFHPGLIAFSDSYSSSSLVQKHGFVPEESLRAPHLVHIDQVEASQILASIHQTIVVRRYCQFTVPHETFTLQNFAGANLIKIEISIRYILPRN